MMKKYLLFPVIMVAGCVVVKPEPAGRVTGYADLPGFRYEQQTLVLTVCQGKKAVTSPVVEQRAEVSVLPYYFDFELPRFMIDDKPLRLNVRLLRADQLTVEAEQEQTFLPGEPVSITLKPASD